MKRTWSYLILASAIALLASACGPMASGLDLTAEPASAATDALADTPLRVATPDAYRSIEIADAGIGFEVPGNWQRESREWSWSPDGSGSSRVGMNWIDLQGPMEPEAALLPRPSQILGSQPIELPWASGRSFTVSVFGPTPEGGDTQAPVQSVETHVLVVAASQDGRRAYDFYAAGSTAKELDALQPVLDEILTSAAPLGNQSGDEAAP